MAEALTSEWPMAEQDNRISESGSPDSADVALAGAMEVVAHDQARLRSFIRRRVPDPADAEDILQEVFYELIEAYRAMQPIGQVTAWLFRVARNRIIDLFRRKARDTQRGTPAELDDEGESRWTPELLPSPDAGPEAAYARSLLLEELDEALEELPAEQRDVFIAHELMGYSFKELAAQTGLSVNTLLSRKHYAVLHLRERLQDIYDQFIKGNQ
jgi:RNA polymerase sigma factor (sigma-70 family)